MRSRGLIRGEKAVECDRACLVAAPDTSACPYSAGGDRWGRAWARGQIADLWWPVTFSRSKSVNKREYVRYYPFTPQLTER